jgi:hypothetical protein
MDYEEPKFTYKEHQLQDASEQVEITHFYSHFPTSNQCTKKKQKKNSLTVFAPPT